VDNYRRINMAKKRVNQKQQERCLDQLEDLDNLQSGLSNRQLDFMQSLHDWNGLFTFDQAAYLDRIWEQHML